MISLRRYSKALKQKAKAKEIIRQYCREQENIFAKRIKVNSNFTDDELIYSYDAFCVCGHGLAYPKDCPPNHYWLCSAILKRTSNRNTEHNGIYPFARFNIKEEDVEQTTRGKIKK